MTLFGGMSKGERARIQMRVRTAMSALAEDTNRYLGGRPPYGYRLVDAGPHPNPAKATLGQRLHHLEPDPATSLPSTGHGDGRSESSTPGVRGGTCPPTTQVEVFQLRQ
jgi:hypothetical protein